MVGWQLSFVDGHNNKKDMTLAPFILEYIAPFLSTNILRIMLMSVSKNTLKRSFKKELHYLLVWNRIY